MQGTWTTADYALIISLCSLALALAGFVWNVWSKFIFPKPPIRVSLGTSVAIGGHENAVTHLEVRNLGLVAVNITQLYGEIEERNEVGRRQIAVLRIYTNWPVDTVSSEMGIGGPKLLEAGSSQTFFLVESPSDFRRIKRFAAKDGFGRTHYVPRKSMKSFRDYYRMQQ